MWHTLPSQGQPNGFFELIKLSMILQSLSLISYLHIEDQTAISQWKTKDIQGKEKICVKPGNKKKKYMSYRLFKIVITPT